MKILMLNHEFPPVGGGAAPVTFELCAQLAQMAHQVDVVTMRYKRLPKHERLDGVNIYRTPAIRKRPNICHTHEMATYFPGAIAKTLSLCRSQKYDVIHCHFMLPGGPLAYTASKLSGIPFLVTCHGSDVPGHNPDRFGLTHKLTLPAWRFVAKRAALLTSPSQSLKNLIQSACPAANVQVVPNGIYPEKYAPAEKTKSILLCSRIFGFKGFQYVIEAVKDLALDWTVDVIGQGPYLPELERIAEGSKTKINFHGWLEKSDDRFYELFKKASIFVFPSEAENFPAVLLEAMSAGCAIITSTAGGCPEVVADAAMLVEPKDPAAIKKNLLELTESENLRQQLSAKALQRVQNFTWPKIAQQYIQCYQQTINPTP